VVLGRGVEVAVGLGAGDRDREGAEVDLDAGGGDQRRGLDLEVPAGAEVGSDRVQDDRPEA
jgi:hypothetical protein